MSLRAKIVTYTALFLVLALVLSVGSLYVFKSFGRSLDTLKSQSQLTMRQEQLAHALQGMEAACELWILTADEKYRNKYWVNHEQMENILPQLVSPGFVDEEQHKILLRDINALSAQTQHLVEISDPLFTDETEYLMHVMRMNADMVHEELVAWHGGYMKAMDDIISNSEEMALNMGFYLYLLVGFTLGFSVILFVTMRRILTEPYSEMLAATERIASGDLSYRIKTDRTDEVGVISKRFDQMAESLEKSDTDMKRKLKETELLLSVTRMSGSMPELKGALAPLAETIAEKMDKDVCMMFLFRREAKRFILESSNIACHEEEYALDATSGIPSLCSTTLKPFSLNDSQTYPELDELCGNLDVRSWMVVPIERDGSCIGIILLGSYEKKKVEEDEIQTSLILAHTIGAAVRNLELYEDTTKQLKQIGIVYELSKALASVYEPDQLLQTITSKISELINARGCIIRLIAEDGKLAIKSFTGPPDEMAKEASIEIGKGIAGWVAKEGRSLFVEDVKNMPEDIRVPAIAAKSAISVPLKKDDKILGTLGLYDKLDARGNVIPFSVDDLSIAEGFSSISALAIEKARMQAEKAASDAQAEESRKRMELLFESVQGGIITLDREFRIITANKYIERWIDLPLVEILGNSALDIFHGKGGICPHCAAKVTFDEGSYNAITQSSGLNYADLSAYPIRDDSGHVTEAVVFIQDITDRVLYQEEIMGLYKEVMQTKEYMESLINNSADAIVTSDINGIVKSWNPAAEKIYGYRKDEVLDKFLPFIPDDIMSLEQENIEKIKGGEVVKLETLRKRKDGTVFEVSLTLSPIKDLSGEIIGISGISRDITDKKRVEKELIRRNQELSRLFFISSAMRSTLEVDKLLRMVLTAVTMSDGLGFNRAILFLLDEERNKLRGAMGIGPEGPEEAAKIWTELSAGKVSLPEMMKKIEELPVTTETFLDRVSLGLNIDLEGDSVLARCSREKKPCNITDTRVEAPGDTELLERLGSEAFAAVPLISRDQLVGLLWVDNHFNKKPITAEDMKFLVGFSDQVASAVSSARLFQKVSLAEAELENIFRSISDMVFFTDKEYTIRNVNEAVVERLGLPKEEIIGKKCYQVFHGKDDPWPDCPHHATINTMEATVKELEDPHLDGTFIASTAPMFDTESKFQGTVHVVRDITEINRLRKQLQTSERMAALGEVAAKVAHEIRNPLVSVGGFAVRLEKKLDGSLKEYAHIIAEEVGRLENILKDILGFVKEVRMSRVVIDFNELVRNTLEFLEKEIQDKGNRLVRDLFPAPIMMYIDPDRVKEAILNILMNSNQATENGTITVRTFIKKNYGVLDVVDTGHGIRDEDINRIFDPFFTTRPTGTGLGLAICKRIVEENDGIIEVKSLGTGEGSHFEIYLPLKED